MRVKIQWSKGGKGGRGARDPCEYEREKSKLDKESDIESEQ